MSGIIDFSLSLFSLYGKTAIVTGANQGLSVVFATALAKAGADIFIPHLTDDISEIKNAIEQAGWKVEFFQGDLTNRDYLDKIIPECVRNFGKADILLNNTGAHAFAEFEVFPDDM